MAPADRFEDSRPARLDSKGSKTIPRKCLKWLVIWTACKMLGMGVYEVGWRGWLGLTKSSESGCESRLSARLHRLGDPDDVLLGTADNEG